MPTSWPGSRATSAARDARRGRSCELTFSSGQPPVRRPPTARQRVDIYAAAQQSLKIAFAGSGGMFKRILIANRGEIACRIIKTARRMGIATVAVFSEADRDALHVEMADEAVPIGPPPASESYLVIDNIIAACRATGAEAVHPGYGFLAEQAAFPPALRRAALVCIGANPRETAATAGERE